MCSNKSRPSFDYRANYDGPFAAAISTSQPLEFKDLRVHGVTWRNMESSIQTIIMKDGECESVNIA